MTETKITAKLPHLDVEMTKAEHPDGGAEVITMRLTAVPSFDAFAGHLSGRALPFGPMAMMAPLMSAPMNPMLAWAEMARAVWAPFLPPAAREMLAMPDDEAEAR
ncbi:hypothetical protein KHP62_00550 [Rhodobacteraceae bacterium NNCM2]|nr:hypothetical protein [Coraliihabitans acroporae]